MIQIVQRGYELPFLETPPSLPPSIERLTEDHLSLLQPGLQAVLAKGAIEEVLMAEVVPKKDAGLRPILDLCPLNDS